MRKRWRASWRPDDWPGWRIELSGPRLDTDWVVSKDPLPDPVGLENGTLGQVTIRRARHASGAYLEDRWRKRSGAYQRRYYPSADDADGKLYAEAVRVLANEPNRPGPKKGSGEVTGESVLRAMLDYRSRTGKLPTQVKLAMDIGCDETAIRRAAPRGTWQTMRKVADKVAEQAAADREAGRRLREQASGRTGR